MDGAVIAAARTLPTWSDKDMPPMPSTERKAARELQEECRQMLAEFPTSSDQDQQILGNALHKHACACTRTHIHVRELFLSKVTVPIDFKVPYRFLHNV